MIPTLDPMERTRRLAIANHDEAARYFYTGTMAFAALYSSGSFSLGYYSGRDSTIGMALSAMLLIGTMFVVHYYMATAKRLAGIPFSPTQKEPTQPSQEGTTRELWDDS